MNYPVLEVVDGTRVGAYCIANGQANSTGFDGRNATSANSLCPGATLDYAQVQFTGVPNAVITIEHSLAIQEQNGIRFAHSDGRSFENVSSLLLDGENGIGGTGLHSAVILFDKSLVTDSVMEFSYNISAAYQ